MKAKAFKAENYIRTPEDVALYLETALEENDPQFFIEALGTVARSQGMTEIARLSGKPRESLYKSFSKKGNPEFATVFSMLRALGLSLRVAPSAVPHESALV